MFAAMALFFAAAQAAELGVVEQVGRLAYPVSQFSVPDSAHLQLSQSHAVIERLRAEIDDLWSEINALHTELRMPSVSDGAFDLAAEGDNTDEMALTLQTVHGLQNTCLDGTDQSGKCNGDCMLPKGAWYWKDQQSNATS